MILLASIDGVCAQTADEIRAYEELLEAMDSDLIVVESVEAADPESAPDAETAAAMESVQGYLAIETIERSPSAILSAMSKRKANPLPSAQLDESATKEEVAAAQEATAQAQQQASLSRFQSQVVRGDWEAVKNHLAGLPKKGAPLVYSHLLSLLAQSNMVQPQEIPAIADAAPDHLTTIQCESIGALLASSLTEDDKPKEMLAAIADRTGRLGGKEEQARRNTARVLMSAGMLEEAGSYVDFPKSPSSEKDFERLDLCSLFKFSRYQSSPTRKGLATAWNLTDLAWKVAADNQSIDETRRVEVIRRLTTLLPKLTSDHQRDWVNELAETNQPKLMMLLRILLQQAESAYQSNDTQNRTTVLKASQSIGDTLSDDFGSREQKDSLRRALQVLATPWLNESLKAVGESRRLIASSDDSEINSLERDLLSETAPSSQWLDLLASDTAAIARKLKAQAISSDDQLDVWLDTVTRLAAYDHDMAQRVVNEYLGIAVHGGSGLMEQVEEAMQQYQGQGYSAATLASYRQYFIQHYSEEMSEGDGIALTRAAQVQSLQQLHEILGRIADAQLPKPSDEALASAFVSAHSTAEVYRKQDIETLFGVLTEIPVGTCKALCKTMRESLAQQWRSQRVQQTAGTNRTEQELAKEVIRGYELAIQMIESSLGKDEANVDLHLLLGLLLFDQSEYRYGLGSDLPTYIKIRDRSFDEIAKAAECYSAALDKDADSEDLSVDVYLRWFQVALGASDLTYLTRQATADEPQIRKLASAIRDLGDPMTDRHLKLFGEGIESELDSVPPALKQRSLQHALIVLGDHGSGDETRRLGEYYEQLLAEVHLHSEVDGSQQIGSGQPFGLSLSVRYSTPLGREGNHFMQLLSKQADGSGGEIDNKKRLEDEIREQLSESFEIEEIRFHQPNVKPQSFGREGWLQTPLAYVVLAAKDPAIDTIAPLQADVQFRDGHGSVLLPITTQKLLVDAKDKAPEPRPFADLVVTQLLDTRELDSGILRLEVSASGKGLMPNLSHIADLAEGSIISGFRVKEIEDHGAAITELEISKDGVRPISERAWIVSMEPEKGAGIAVLDQFTFPEITSQEAELSYEQYADADIVAAERSVAIAPQVTYDRTKFAAYVALAGIAGLATLGCGLWLWRRKSNTPKQVTYRVPDQLTPFSLVAFLRKMASDKQLSLAPEDSKSLTTTIADLEARYFSDQDFESNGQAELQHVFDRWNTKAQKQFARRTALSKADR